MRLIRSIWNDIKRGENFDSYLVIVAAFGIALLNIFQVPVDNLIAPITLGVLGLLAISILGSRHRIEELLRRTNQTMGIAFLDEFPPEMDRNIEAAKDVLLIGVTFSRTIRTYYSTIEQKLKKGHSVKFLLVHPDGSAVAITAVRTYRPITTEQKKQEIMTTIRSLQELQKAAPKKLEIRTIENPLTYGVRAINPNTDSGVLYIEHYSYKTQDSKPRFIIHASDRYWYNYYMKEIQNLWNDGKEWQSAP